MNRRDFLTTCGRCSLGALLGCGLGAAEGLLGSRPAAGAVGNVSNYEARFWEKASGNKVVCRLCPRGCTLAPGQRGNCNTRENRNGQMVTLVYGKPVAIHLDPVEKAPFFHFLPGHKTLAVGTAGCNLHCKWCQNWQFTQTLPEKTDNQNLLPESMAQQAKDNGLSLIIFTLNDPASCLEYALDTAAWARSKGLYTLAHTAGFINPEPLEELCSSMDALAVDLKGFTEDFYENMTGGKLSTVLATLKTIHARRKWLEVINLVVPGHNDDPATFRKMCEWLLENLGPHVPLFVSRFFPSYQLRNTPATPLDTLRNLRKIAYEVGLHYAYLGNTPGDPAESTYCPACGWKVMKRNGSEVTNTGLKLPAGTCIKCGYKIPGYWQWGAS